MDQLQNLDKAISQMQDELLAKINKMKEVIAIYAKAHSDVETVMSSDSSDFQMCSNLKGVSEANGKFAFTPAGPENPMPVTKRPYNKHKSELNKLKSKLANTAKKKGGAPKEYTGPTVAEKTREFMDRYFETSEVFTMNSLVDKIKEVIPSANYNNVQNAYARYLQVQKWDQRVHINEDTEKEILLTKKEEVQ